MGRRKIEIKPINDDRNRSVTFLKRKGGLFKKAHELSVLCSVDVAVIIFGNNKKLYEYSSGDIGEILNRYQFYGGANEHKGPADFNGKGRDDDDDDDEGSGMSQHGDSVPQQMLPPQFQNQAAFQHMRNQPPVSSPPVQNGAFHPLPQRQHTPQHDSRPSSRNDAQRRPSSNLAPQPANGYAFMPNPPMYNPHQAGMQPHGLPPHMQPAQHHAMPPQQGQQYPNYGAPQHPQQQQQQPPPQQHPHQQQVHQIYAEEQRRPSMPTPYQQPDRSQVKLESSPPQPQHQQINQQQSELKEEENQQPPPLQDHKVDPVKRMSAKSRSIFTPIDESRSILSQHWASSTSSGETPRSGTATAVTSNARAQSIETGASSRSSNPPQQSPKNRNASISAASERSFAPPPRTNSASVGGTKRPVLTVQIPDGASDGGSADSSPHSATNAAPAQRNDHPSVSGVVLPPPSPSASALLSAGASGPPNPFARPHPVSQNSQNSQNSNNTGSMSETPVSALLPSRYMNNEFLPSPSSFYPDWNFSRESNTLPSPLNFATPVVGTGPSFLREEPENMDKGGTKRKTPDPENGTGDDGGDAKRSRLAT